MYLIIIHTFFPPKIYNKNVYITSENGVKNAKYTKSWKRFLIESTYGETLLRYAFVELSGESPYRSMSVQSGNCQTYLKKELSI